MQNESLYYLLIPILITLMMGCKPKATMLFNGVDLTGWHADVPVQDSHPDTVASFVVDKGRLISMGEPRGHLITDKSYSDYQLDIRYRFTGEPGNCGILVHASAPRALYDMFPQSIEVQMMHENAGDFWCIVEDIEVDDMVKRRGPQEEWGIIEGKKRRIINLTDDSENPLGQWNDMKIQCDKDEIKVWVNGDLVNHGYNSTATSGQIAIQAEGAVVEFGWIKLRELD